MEYNITLREKDKGWQVIISYKDAFGRWRQKSRQGFASRRDAKLAGDEILDEIKDNLPVYMTDSKITFKEFSTNYMKERSPNMAFGSVLIYKHALAAFAPLNDMLLTDIKHTDIQKIFYSLNIQAITANMYLSKISTMLKAAADNDLISKNPAAAVKPLKKEVQKINALTKERLNYVLNKMKPYPDTYVACCIAAYTGLRKGEVQGLRWKDIDFDNDYVHVRQQFAVVGIRKFGIKRLKTNNSYRSVPLPRKLKKILKDYKKADTEMLFSNNKYSTIAAHLHKYGVRFHDFRHTYATMLLASGMDIKTVAALLGDNVETVLKTYIHFTDDLRKSAKNKLLNFF